jgi:hypothetical protein
MWPRYNIRNFSSRGTVIVVAASHERRRVFPSAVESFDRPANVSAAAQKDQLHGAFSLQSDRPLLGARPRLNTA